MTVRDTLHLPPAHPRDGRRHDLDHDVVTVVAVLVILALFAAAFLLLG